jgi:low affinity Fe/Cu permease
MHTYTSNTYSLLIFIMALSIEHRSFTISIATALSLFLYTLYIGNSYGAWSQRIESRLEKLELSISIEQLKISEDRTSIQDLQKKIASQDVTLAEIKKDVAQILFEIRKGK